MHPAPAQPLPSAEPRRADHRPALELSLDPEIRHDFEIIAALFGLDPAVLAGQVLTDYVHRQQQLAAGRGRRRPA